MPITQDGDGRINYTEPNNKRRSDSTGTAVDTEFAIVDDTNVLKQIQFKVNPTTTAAGIVTLQCDIAGDQTINLTSLSGGAADSFTIIQTDAGTSPTADSSADTLTLTSPKSTITITGNSTTDTVSFEVTPRVVALSDAATIATDASLGDVFTVTLGGNRTLGAPTNPTSGQKAVWRVKQDGTGGRTLAFNAVFRFGDDVTTPTLSTAAGKTDYIGAIYNGTDSKWDVVAVARGYS